MRSLTSSPQRSVVSSIWIRAPVSSLAPSYPQDGGGPETVFGAVSAYLLIGMFFAFVYRAAGANEATAFFGAQGDGTFAQDLFFSFTTLTTTGYGNLVPG